MDKRLISSITTNIAKLEKKIAANDAENAVMKNKRDKFQEMLELLAPESTPEPVSGDAEQATLPEPSKAEVPAFLKKQHEAATV